MKPGRIDQHIEPAELPRTLLDGSFAGLRVGDVDGREGPTRHGLEDRCHPGGVAGDPEHRRATLGEQLRHRRTEAGRRSGHQGNLPAQLSHV
jgi:hypothetical protein